MVSNFNNKSLKKELKRKSIHVSSLWLPFAMYFLPKNTTICLFFILFLLDFFIEFGNFKKYSWARHSFGFIFSKTLREEETSRIKFTLSGGFYVFLSAFICSVCFTKEISVVAMTIMIFSDACAAIVGKSIGKIKIYHKKTLEGSTAFFISAVLINLCFIQIIPFGWKNIIAALFLTIAEIYGKSLKIDDNLSVPLLYCFIMSFF